MIPTRPLAANSTPSFTPRQRIQALAARNRVIVGASVAALALYALTPWPALALLPLAAYATLTWLRLDVALCLLPLAFPFWFIPKPVVGHLVFPLSEIALGVCSVVAAARVIRAAWGARPVWTGNWARTLASWRDMLRIEFGWPLLAGIGLFACGASLGLLAAVHPHEALRAYRWEIAEPLLYLAQLVGFVHGELALRRMVWAFLASAGVVAVLAVIQVTVWPVVFTPLAQGNQLVPLAHGADSIYRATGIIYGSPNSLGAYLERALPLTLALLWLAPGRRGAGGLTVWTERAAAGGLCLLYLIALVWSDSRGAWAGAAAGVALVVCLAVGRPWLLAALAAAGAVMAFVLRGPLLAAALGGHGGTGELRTLVWLAAWHMLRDHPLLGIGLDQFLYQYSNLYTTHPYWITTLNNQSTQVWREPTLSHPHNLILDLWLSVGLLGLLGFAIILWALGQRCLRLWRAWRQRSPDADGIHGTAWAAVVAVGVAGSVLASLVHGMVDSAYFVPDLALVFWWSIALVWLAGRARETATAPAP